MECKRFQVYLRMLDFLNLMSIKVNFESLGGEFELNDYLKTLVI